ncbi:MAG: hypothetical protein J5959_13000, partial [Butyrivibrio sp.]|nr:hypothetical protein [Butyrivibrio sp.]
IEWIVLDVQGGKSLLLSEYVLDTLPYNATKGYVTWESCTLRKWLNSTFVKEALSNTEQNLIAETIVDNSQSQGVERWNGKGGNNTRDKLFSLSHAEALNYLTNKTARQCVASDYAILQGAYVNARAGSCWWWLRSPGHYQDYANHVRFDGTLGDYSEVTSNTIGVRPAMWVDLEKIQNNLENEKARATIVRERDAYRTIGQTVTLGRYEQDNNPDNGSEPIEWIVLDVQDGKSLLLSKYVLDSVKYQEEAVKTVWEYCDLRKWLNDGFLNKAFCRTEKELIPLSSIENIGHAEYSITGGNKTTDHIFLLSYDEARQLLDSPEKRICHPTPYAEKLCKPNPYGMAQGTLYSEYDSLCWWWLRSFGIVGVRCDALCVTETGTMDRNIVNATGGGVRPALWVDLAAIDAIVEKDQIRQTGEQLRIKGSTVSFGNYEQDNDLNNGSEPIEWIVLDVQPGKSLLISKYGLDRQPYHTSKKDITWEWCSLRSWLNSTFLSKAFSVDEQKAILKTTVDNSENSGNNTENNAGQNITSDRVFVLSHLEKAKSFVLSEEAICKATAFAKAQGAYTDSNDNGWWWLRILGSSQHFAPTVNTEGTLGYPSNVNRSDVTVRPALWIDWNADYFNVY